MSARYRVVIAGGGTAGWMTAAALAHALPRDRYTIELVQSAAIGTVGVGEATIPGLLDFHAALGIDEDAFLAAVGGTFKLGIEFVDWGRVGTRYMHAFGRLGLDLDGQPFHQHWLRARAGGDGTPLGAYSMAGIAAAQGRFMRPVADPQSPVSQLRYAFHLDAGRYADFLAGLAESRGVTRREGQIVEVVRDGESGDIAMLALADGRRIAGDLFVDCTGFRGLLIGEALGEPFEDWSRWLPCDRAFAVPCERTGAILPYTRATAHAAGWQWRIPLQHRTGNGYVFASACEREDRARERLLASLEAPATAEPAMLRFTPGRRRAAWRANCVAIGLAAGFVEPLESTSIHLIQHGITRLLALMPDEPVRAPERDRYNAMMAHAFDQVRDFVIAHYAVGEREDGELWRAVRATALPDSLRATLDLYAQRGRLFEADEDLFKISNWISVLVGQGLLPQRHDPVADKTDAASLRAMLADLRDAYRTAAAHMPPHDLFLARCCSRSGPAPSQP